MEQAKLQQEVAVNEALPEEAEALPANVRSAQEEHNKPVAQSQNTDRVVVYAGVAVLMVFVLACCVVRHGYYAAEGKSTVAAIGMDMLQFTVMAAMGILAYIIASDDWTNRAEMRYHREHQMYVALAREHEKLATPYNKGIKQYYARRQARIERAKKGIADYYRAFGHKGKPAAVYEITDGYFRPARFAPGVHAAGDGDGAYALFDPEEK